MIEFKNNKINVECLECLNKHNIDMIYIETNKHQRSIGYEYDHTYCGQLKCSSCKEEMKVTTTIFEYPKGFINYIETSNIGCLILDEEITEEFLNIT